MGYCFWTSRQRVEPSAVSYHLQSLLKHQCEKHPDFPSHLKASFSIPTCSLSLSLSVTLYLSLSLSHSHIHTRREWRLRTMSTSTWRWRGRMALWCSLKSSGTLHSANWWKPIVNGRWVHGTIVNSVFALFVLLVTSGPGLGHFPKCYHLFWWSTFSNKQVFLWSENLQELKYLQAPLWIAHPLIVGVTELSTWVLAMLVGMTEEQN